MEDTSCPAGYLPLAGIEVVSPPRLIVFDIHPISQTKSICRNDQHRKTSSPSGPKSLADCVSQPSRAETRFCGAVLDKVRGPETSRGHDDMSQHEAVTNVGSRP